MKYYFESTEELIKELTKHRKVIVRRFNKKLDDAIKTGNKDKISQAKKDFVSNVGVTELDLLD